MNKPFIFIIGIICGIFIYAITNSISGSLKDYLVKYSSQPVISNQFESPKAQSPGQQAPPNESGQLPNDSSKDYVRYWQSNGIKFKDVGSNGIEKTYVWNASLNEWIDTGCVGNFDEN